MFIFYRLYYLKYLLPYKKLLPITFSKYFLGLYVITFQAVLNQRGYEGPLFTSFKTDYLNWVLI